MKVIATYPICSHGGIEILNLAYDSFKDYDIVQYRFNFGNTETEKIHTVKLYSNTKGTYFKTNNKRVYLNECMKV